MPTRKHPANPRGGFTLLELLVVVVIIGVLAAIAIPKFASSKERAYLSSIKADLRNLVTAQESYFSQHGTYTATLTTAQFATSVGVAATVAAVGASGWNATAWHTGTTRSCAIFVGDAPAVAPAVNAGQVTCN